MALAAGTRLGNYEVIDLLGVGGMGEVYRARDTKLGRDVALKVLPSHLATDKERLERFEREARLLASVNHPNVATLHGLEEHDHTKILVMELVEGETLAARIARRPLDPREALPLFEQVADGLEAAHQKTVVHRDLKPPNIMITADGNVKLLDFGLAKAFGPEVAGEASPDSPTMTRDGTEAGVILGTAAYMSPEQARGRSVDKRTDIWAFGCCLFEALTGEPAFLGETISDTIAAILEREPEWSQLPEATPPGVRRLLERSLRKDTRRRLRDAGDVANEIHDVGDEPMATTAGARHRPGMLVLGAVAVASLTAIAVGFATRRDSDRVARVTRSELSLPADTPLVLSYTPSAVIAPDGDTVVFVAGPGRTDGHLFIRRLDELQSRRIDGTEGALTPFFAPDGRWIGFHSPRARKLMKVAINGGAPVAIADSRDIRGASWGPDDWIVFSPALGSGLVRVHASGGEPETLTTVDRAGGEKSHRMPDVLPNGKGVLFVVGTSDITSFDDGRIELLSIESGTRQVLIEGGTCPRYSPTGHVVYARAGSLLVVPFDAEQMRVTGPPVTILEGVMTSSMYGDAEFAIAHNGSLLYAPGDPWGHDRRVMWFDRHGQSEQLIETARAFELPIVTPDGRFVAVAIEGATDNIWIQDTERNTLTRFAFGWDNTNPVWSPDGSRLAFRSNRAGQESNVYVQDARGNGSVVRLTKSPFRERPTSWSPDGEALAIRQDHPDTGQDLWVLNLDDGAMKPFAITAFSERNASFSPDGNWLAFVSDESGRDEVCVAPYPGPGGKRPVSTDGGIRPKWNPRGGELFYRNGGKLMGVDVETDGGLQLGKPRLVFEDASLLPAFDVAPDGERFIMVDVSQAPERPNKLVLVQNWDEELNRLVPPGN